MRRLGASCLAPWLALCGLLLCAALAQAAPQPQQTQARSEARSEAQTPVQACEPRIVRVMAARSATAQRPDTGWEAVTLPDAWGRRWPDYSGTVWYRVDWQRGCPETGQGPAPDIGLSIDSISMAGEVFINDDAIWRDRHLAEPLSRSWNTQRFWLLPASALRGEHNTLWVRVEGIAAQKGGLGVVALGEPQAVALASANHHWRSNSLLVINLTASGVLGCIALFVWLSSRSQTVFGWYALVSASWVLFGANALLTEAWPFSSSLDVARANTVAYMVFIACFCVFTWRLLGLRPAPRLERGLWLLTGACAVYAWTAADWAGLGWAGHPFTLIYFGSTLFVSWRALRTRELEHQIIAACLVIIAFIGVRDTLVLLEVVQSRVFLTGYTFLPYLMMTAVMLMLRMVRTTRSIEQFNRELTDSVERACADLSATLEHEHALALTNERLRERLQLARDLHDGLGGQIVRSIMLVEQGDGQLEKPHLLSMLKLLRDDLRQVVDSGASASAARPEDPAQWSAALRYRFANLFDEVGIASHWHLPAAWHTPPTALQGLLLARVAEEALTNVLKHSRAQNVRVALQCPDAAHLVLCITDDGVGFDVDLIRRAGLGIGMSSMRARMERMGGTLVIESQPGATVLRATLLLSASEPREAAGPAGDLQLPQSP